VQKLPDWGLVIAELIADFRLVIDDQFPIANSAMGGTSYSHQ